jgi:hypothetical protein
MCDVMDPDRVNSGTIGLILSAIIDGMRADRPNEVRRLLMTFLEISFSCPCLILFCTVLYRTVRELPVNDSHLSFNNSLASNCLT